MLKTERTRGSRIDIMRKDITRAALSVGLSVERVVKEYAYARQRHVFVLRKRLAISDRLCLLCEIKKRAPRSIMGGTFRCSYGSLALYDFFVVRLALPNAPMRTFILPADVLRDALFASTERLTATLFVPLTRGYVPGPLDLNPYEQAWHLFRKGETKAA